MAGIGHWNACANRLYYACFYAASALLLKHGLAASKHTGVQALLNRHFVRPGLLPADLGQFYNSLFEYRHEGDYTDFVRFERDQVHPWIAVARQFVDKVEMLISTQGQETPDA